MFATRHLSEADFTTLKTFNFLTNNSKISLPLHPSGKNPIHNNHLNNISMYLTKEVKEELFAKHGGAATNTGSAEGQIALFTFRINHLTGHLKKNRHDFNTERSLVKLVGKRRSLLDYLKKKDINRYREIIKELNIRK
jgi:small subunit ribosomal protein S15